MKKYLISGLLVATLIASIGAVLAAKPDFVKDLPESKLQKVVFIRYKPEKGPTCDNDGICEKKENWKSCPSDCSKDEEEPPAESTCYGFLSGAKPKWNWVEDYYYNNPGLGSSIALAVGTWEAPVAGDIFGNGVAENHPWGEYDYYNSFSYGDYPDPNVLGVAAIWFRGKDIYEYDIMLDSDFFPGGVYDLDTVVLHELGHATGLDDLYDSTCVDEVMYGRLGVGEIKDSLQSGDLIGIQTLYGN